jgi:hypothetical protein
VSDYSSSRPPPRPPVVLRDWGVLLDGQKLEGVPTGHPTEPDGRRIWSGRIADATGRVVHTESGTTYVLDGPPNGAYAAFLHAQGLEVDPHEPIRTRPIPPWWVRLRARIFA